MENFLKNKYAIVEDISVSKMIDNKLLTCQNHMDTKFFWDFCNDLAIFEFKKYNYSYNDILNSNLCHFCKPHGFPNTGGLIKAKNFDRETFSKILKIDMHDSDNLEIINTNFVESNHFVYLTYLLSTLNFNTKQEYNIVDIGGGYGNMRRLLLKLIIVNSYTIFDIESSLFYNKKFFEHTNDTNYLLMENENFNGRGLYNISLNFRNDFVYNSINDSNIKIIDITIATHSLSELDMDNFYWYLINIISKTKILIYATQTVSTNFNPVSGEISLFKINLIKKYMDVILDIGQPGQESNCKLYIFKNKVNF